MIKAPAVYLLANKPYGTLYVGVTSNLLARVWQHKNNQAEGFSKRHRSEERRVGKECVQPCISRWSPYH